MLVTEKPQFTSYFHHFLPLVNTLEEVTNCAEFADIRQKHYSANTLEEVLTTGNYAHVLSFLKEINLYKKV